MDSGSLASIPTNFLIYFPPQLRHPISYLASLQCPALTTCRLARTTLQTNLCSTQPNPTPAHCRRGRFLSITLARPREGASPRSQRRWWRHRRGPGPTTIASSSCFSLVIMMIAFVFTSSPLPFSPS